MEAERRKRKKKAFPEGFRAEVEEGVVYCCVSDGVTAPPPFQNPVITLSEQ